MVKVVQPIPVRRSTKQRSAIFAILRKFDEFKSAQEIHQNLIKNKNNIGLATVYRTLQALTTTGEIDVIRNVEGENLYRHCGQETGHHHHLICRECGLTIKIEVKSLEDSSEKIGKENGFSQIEHYLDIYGICKNCNKLKIP